MTDSVPENAPVLAGEKVTRKVQEAPAPRLKLVPEQVPPEREKLPLTVTFDTVRVLPAEPVFVSVTVCAALVVSLLVVNVRLEGAREATGPLTTV